MQIYGRGYIYTFRALPWFPAGPALELYCNLLNIEESDTIPSAAVVFTPNKAPYLLINPMFVDTYVQHDAHLALLLLHELYHVLFAHLLLGNSFDHNIAFDAIINAYLMRRLNGLVYRGFFEQLNEADKFPAAFLRPPVGWPDNPQYPQFKTVGATALLKRLYPPLNELASTPLPMVREILEMLQRSRPQQQPKEGDTPITGGGFGFPMPADANEHCADTDTSTGTTTAPNSDEYDEWETPNLLGDHENINQQTAEQQDSRDAFVKAAMAASAEKASTGGGDEEENSDGFGMGSELQWVVAAPAKPQIQARKRFWKLLRHITQQSETMGMPTRMGELTLPAHSMGMNFNPKDRYAYTRWQLTGTILSRQPTTIYTRHLPPAATLYLDVSGSMDKVIAEMVALIQPFMKRNVLRVYEFSTEVATVQNLADVGSTGGTNIMCVLEHILQNQMQIGQIIILTDGEVGNAEQTTVTRVNQLHKPIHVVLTQDCREAMQSFATTFTLL